MTTGPSSKNKFSYLESKSVSTMVSIAATAPVTQARCASVAATSLLSMLAGVSAMPTRAARASSAWIMNQIYRRGRARRAW
jgi:hypothetical protein